MNFYLLNKKISGEYQTSQIVHVCYLSLKENKKPETKSTTNQGLRRKLTTPRFSRYHTKKNPLTRAPRAHVEI
jgi:hypothetical protein